MNASGVPLILRQEPVHRADLLLWRYPIASVAVVYADVNGTLVQIDRRLGLRESWRSPYRVRYEVDISDHERAFEVQTTPLPAKGDVYAFETIVNVGFRVTDPVTVVRRNIADALPVVYQRLIDMMRSVSRDYDIQDSAAAEQRINRMFNRPIVLEEGITVYRCTARLSPDRAAKQHVKAKTAAERNVEVIKQRHVGTRDATQYELELEHLRHEAELHRRDSERRALGTGPLDYQRLLQQHLILHPDDTERVARLVADYERAQLDRRDTQYESRAELFKFMIEQDLVNGVDVDRFRTDMLGGIRPDPVGESGQQRLPQSATWIDQPAPVVEPPADPALGAAPDAALDQVLDEPPAAQAGTAHPATGWDTAGWDTVGGGLLPVYVVVDESAAVRKYLDDLDEGVAALCRALADTPAVTPRVRLTVLGVAEDVTAHLAGTDPRSVPELPRFTARGTARYAAAFRDLLTRLPDDIDALKAEHPLVHRPTVFFLTGGPPVDNQECWPLHRRLVDRERTRYAPNIVAYGIGANSNWTVRHLASPEDLAFVADASSDEDVRHSIRQFFAAVVDSVVQSRGTLAVGKAEMVINPPAGFRLASEVV